MAQSLVGAMEPTHVVSTPFLNRIIPRVSSKHCVSFSSFSFPGAWLCHPLTEGTEVEENIAFVSHKGVAVMYGLEIYGQDVALESLGRGEEVEIMNEYSRRDNLR
jgi:hypothetical protein